MTQVAVNPVTFMMFVNDPGLFDENYRRFVVGRLRELLPIAEVPIRLLARPKTSRRPPSKRRTPAQRNIAAHGFVPENDRERSA